MSLENFRDKWSSPDKCEEMQAFSLQKIWGRRGSGGARSNNKNICVITASKKNPKLLLKATSDFSILEKK